MDLEETLPFLPGLIDAGPPPAFSPEEASLLVGIALLRLALHLGIEGGPALREPVAGPLTLRASGFVSLYVEERLRGCVGLLRSEAPLWRSVGEMAVAAATRDHRFAALEKEEYPRLRVEISVLGPMADLPAGDPEAALASIRVGEHGLSIERGAKRGLLLPQVAARSGFGARRFLEETCRKAGLAPGAWLETSTRLRIFRTRILGGGVGGGAAPASPA